jgi:hypothetical protein
MKRYRMKNEIILSNIPMALFLLASQSGRSLVGENIFLYLLKPTGIPSLKDGILYLVQFTLYLSVINLKGGTC